MPIFKLLTSRVGIALISVLIILGMTVKIVILEKQIVTMELAATKKDKQHAETVANVMLAQTEVMDELYAEEQLEAKRINKRNSELMAKVRRTDDFKDPAANSIAEYIVGLRDSRPASTDDRVPSNP